MNKILGYFLNSSVVYFEQQKGAAQGLSYFNTFKQGFFSFCIKLMKKEEQNIQKYGKKDIMSI